MINWIFDEIDYLCGVRTRRTPEDRIRHKKMDKKRIKKDIIISGFTDAPEGENWIKEEGVLYKDKADFFYIIKDQQIKELDLDEATMFGVASSCTKHYEVSLSNPVLINGEVNFFDSEDLIYYSTGVPINSTTKDLPRAILRRLLQIKYISFMFFRDDFIKEEQDAVDVHKYIYALEESDILENHYYQEYLITEDAIELCKRIAAEDNIVIRNKSCLREIKQRNIGEEVKLWVEQETQND